MRKFTNTFSRGNSRYSAILMKIAVTRDLTETGGITSRYTAIFEFFTPFLGPVQKERFLYKKLIQNWVAFPISFDSSVGFKNLSSIL